MRFHVDWRGERSILYRGVETSPYQTRFKTVKLHNEPKWTIFVGGRLEQLQMISKLGGASEDTGTQGVNCDIPLKRRTKHFL